MAYIENVLIDSDNIMSPSTNITLRKINAKLYAFDKMYIDKELIEGNLWINLMREELQLKSSSFKNIYLFYDGDSRTCKSCLLMT